MAHLNARIFLNIPDIGLMKEGQGHDQRTVQTRTVPERGRKDNRNPETELNLTKTRGKKSMILMTDMREENRSIVITDQGQGQIQEKERKTGRPIVKHLTVMIKTGKGQALGKGQSTGKKIGTGPGLLKDREKGIGQGHMKGQVRSPDEEKKRMQNPDLTQTTEILRNQTERTKVLADFTGRRETGLVLKKDNQKGGQGRIVVIRAQDQGLVLKLEILSRTPNQMKKTIEMQILRV